MLPTFVLALLVADPSGQVANSENALGEDGRKPPVVLVACKCVPIMNREE